MVLFAAVFEDVPDGPTPYKEGVGKQLAVTAPGHRFGAHDGNPLACRDPLEFLHDHWEIWGHHEIRVSSECPIAPARVWRIGRRFSKPAEISTPEVINFFLCQRRGQAISGEVRKPS